MPTGDPLSFEAAKRGLGQPFAAPICLNPPEITPDELEHIARAVVGLTEIRQRGCNHLMVENFAPELFGKLLGRLSAYKQGLRCSRELWESGGHE